MQLRRILHERKIISTRLCSVSVLSREQVTEGRCEQQTNHGNQDFTFCLVLGFSVHSWFRRDWSRDSALQRRHCPSSSPCPRAGDCRQLLFAGDLSLLLECKAKVQKFHTQPGLVFHVWPPKWNFWYISSYQKTWNSGGRSLFKNILFESNIGTQKMLMFQIITTRLPHQVIGRWNHLTALSAIRIGTPWHIFHKSRRGMMGVEPGMMDQSKRE